MGNLILGFEEESSMSGLNPFIVAPIALLVLFALLIIIF